MNRKKLLRKIINNQKNVRFDDFIVIIEAFGFYLTRSEGSHFIGAGRVVFHSAPVSISDTPFSIRRCRRRNG